MTRDKQTILIIEDTPANIEILSEILGDDYDIIFATNGEDGLILAADEAPDIILLDVMMPEMDGYEVCIRLKEKPETCNIPVIFVTAMGQEEDETRGLDLGAIDYITKPISPPVVKARVRNQLELKKYRDVLENLATAADRAKREFLMCINHELRTPLTPILGMTDMIMATEKDDEKRNSLAIVQKSANKLLRIIEELIETSRLEAYGATPDIAPFLLRTVLDSLKSELLPEATAKGLQLTFSTNPETPKAISSDQYMIRKILSKLIGNSIKFTQAGTITVEVTFENQGTLHFCVRDTGIGISADDMKRIFQDFTQADSSLSRGNAGLGLGLTMARKISTILGGRIWSEDHNGKGATFHFELPVTTLDKF
jgi:signal transduction histidine kinase